MPCPHNEISIVQRSQQQSAVAAAAYQSGEKLFCEYDQEVKHYPEKRGIVHNEILLPANAPQKYADRNTLWNAAEAVEKQWNSQLARRWVLTIPREIPPDQYAVLVREFCEQQFVSKGMIADFAIHDPHPPGHNPHAHVLLTMRAMDEHGKWLPKWCCHWHYMAGVAIRYSNCGKGQWMWHPPGRYTPYFQAFLSQPFFKRYTGYRSGPSACESSH